MTAGLAASVWFASQEIVGFGWWDRIREAVSFYPMQIASSALIGVALGVLGCFVVLRRMALIGDALSHAILPGVVLAFLAIHAITGHLDGLWGVWGLFLGALFAGLVTAFGIRWISQYARAKDDSATGIVFTAMFALGVVLISLQPKGTHFDLTCFLFGSPLAIKTQDFWSIAIVTPLVLGFLWISYRGLKILSFDPQMAAAIGIPIDRLHYLFMGFLAATVVAALRTVGVIMSVAMLITPAAAAYQITDRLSVMLVLSGAFGGISAVFGFLLAFAFNIPTGPAMVLVATLIFFLCLFFGPEYGLLSRLLRRRAIQRHILQEDVLKALAMSEESLAFEAIAKKLSEAPIPAVRAAIQRLRKEGALIDEDSKIGLSAIGKERAILLIRSHRLWESYLAQEQISPRQLHPMAEKLEHAHHLSEDLAEQLGHPQTDPHGSSIPPPPQGSER